MVNCAGKQKSWIILLGMRKKKKKARSDPQSWLQLCFSKATVQILSKVLPPVPGVLQEMWKKSGFFCWFGVFLLLFVFFSLYLSANFMQCHNPVLFEEKVHISMDTELLSRQRSDYIKD